MPRRIPPLDQIRTVHLMGVCGTGMGAFAGLLRELGLTVTGSDDNVYPPMSGQLAAQRIEVMKGYSAANLAHRPDLVVVGNVIRKTNPEAAALLESDLSYTSFPEALSALILAHRTPVVVAGTHGKTTTSSIIAWVLNHAGRQPGFLIGGVLKNFAANQGLGTDGGPFVVEGDEYDTAFFDKVPKFVHYRPQIAVLTHVEYDHADIYPDFDAVKDAFRRLVALIPEEGLLIGCGDHPTVRELIFDCEGRIQTYGENKDREWRGELVKTEGDTSVMRVHHRADRFLEARVRLVGKHNLMNVTAAVAVLKELGLSAHDIADGLASFDGVRRRQEVVAEVRGITVVDDFAHHPTAVRETIAAMRLRFPKRRLWAVFEPRSATSRRRVFQDEYPQALAGADKVLIAQVHQAQEPPSADRFDPDRLAASIQDRGVDARSPGGVDQIVDTLVDETRPDDVILLMSNGAFGGIYQKLPAALED